MFFRRVLPKSISFEDRMQDLRKAGFTVKPAGGRVMVTRDCYGVVLEEVPGGLPRIVERAGVLMPGGIGKLVDGGYQKFFLAPDGRKKHALAAELTAIDEFQEDLREAL